MEVYTRHKCYYYIDVILRPIKYLNDDQAFDYGLNSNRQKFIVFIVEYIIS